MRLSVCQPPVWWFPLHIWRRVGFSLSLSPLYNSNEPQESGFCKSSAAVCPLRRLLYLVLAQFSEKNREYQSSEPRSLRRTRLLHKMCLFNNFPGPCRSSPANFQHRQSIFTKDLDFELEVALSMFALITKKTRSKNHPKSQRSYTNQKHLIKDFAHQRVLIRLCTAGEIKRTPQ